MSKSKPDPTHKPPRAQRGLVDPQENGPTQAPPGHENDGGESLLSGRSREDDADEVDDVELPPTSRRQD